MKNLLTTIILGIAAVIVSANNSYAASEALDNDEQSQVLTNAGVPFGEYSSKSKTPLPGVSGIAVSLTEKSPRLAFFDPHLDPAERETQELERQLTPKEPEKSAWDRFQEMNLKMNFTGQTVYGILAGIVGIVLGVRIAQATGSIALGIVATFGIAVALVIFVPFIFWWLFSDDKK